MQPAHSRRSHGGWLVYLNGGAIAWKRGLLQMIMLSCCEAEFAALCWITREVRYLRTLLEDLGNSQKESTLVWKDRKDTIVSAEAERSSAGRAKHIDAHLRGGERAQRYASATCRQTGNMPTSRPSYFAFGKRATPSCESPIIKL